MNDFTQMAAGFGEVKGLLQSLVKRVDELSRIEERLETKIQTRMYELLESRDKQLDEMHSDLKCIRKGLDSVDRRMEVIERLDPAAKISALRNDFEKVRVSRLMSIAYGAGVNSVVTIVLGVAVYLFSKINVFEVALRLFSK